MGQIGRTALKAFFETGDIPTEAQFIDLIDSLLNFTDDDSDDLTEGSTKLLLTTAERTTIGNTSGTNTGDMSNANVKTAYESNADTNEFSDAEQTKVTNAFVKNVDNSDNIVESSDKKFLDSSSEQLIAGNKEFSGQAHANNAAGVIISFSATPTFDFDNGNDQEMPVTGNVTSFSVSNVVGSANYSVWLINDATPGRTVAAPTGSTEMASSDTHDTAANAINLYQFKTRPGGTLYHSILNI